MQLPDLYALQMLQGDQVEDFTQIDRKRLEFTFNTNIIAMCVAICSTLGPMYPSCRCCHLVKLLYRPRLQVLCTLKAVVAADGFPFATVMSLPLLTGSPLQQ